MGFLSWTLAALAAFGLCRWIRHRRKPWPIELAVALAAAIAAGIAATAMNFGGWKVIEPAAIVFATLAAVSAIPLARLR